MAMIRKYVIQLVSSIKNLESPEVDLICHGFSWRLVFYSSMFTYGLVSLWDEDYLWDTKYCWIGYPVEIWAMKDKIYW